MGAGNIRQALKFIGYWVGANHQHLVAPGAPVLHVLGAAGTVYRLDVLSGGRVFSARVGGTGVVGGMPGAHDTRFAVFYSDGSMRVLDVAEAMRGEIGSFDVIPPGVGLVSVLFRQRRLY